MTERFLVTGAMGCIGAWTVKRLAEVGVPVWTYDLPGSGHRLKLIMDEGTLSQVSVIAGDITDFAHFEQVVVDTEVTTCLRSCLMKPEHHQWLDRIWSILLQVQDQLDA